LSKDSKIEWTRHTFNPWWGCTKVSPGCKHCYAETWAKRLGKNLWGHQAERRELSAAYWSQPFAWDALAASEGARARVFCASMADVFEDRRDLDERRARLWQIIERTPNLDWLLLTKRPHNIEKLAPWSADWPENVWLGATAENQNWLDRRMPFLVASRARTLFLSCEPLLGPIDLSQWVRHGKKKGGRFVDWVIGGGESGHGARPMSPDWIRGLRDQCAEHKVRFHFKQWGNWRPTEEDATERGTTKTLFLTSGDRITVVNVGKKVAGRTLDGRLWDELPRANA
jgi:protein gp37